MPTLGQSGKYTLLDIAKATDPDGKIAAVAELMSQTNEILFDMPWMEGNMETGHKATIRTGLPSGVWRQMYQGVPNSKSNRAQIIDACGMYEARSEIDVDMADMNGNSAAFRLSETKAFMEGINQQFCDTLFYGNTAVNPERFMGLAPRYSAISGATNGQNVLSAGGSGSDNTSIWLIGWGHETCTGIYPKGSTAGLKHEDLGVDDAFDANNNRYRALMDLYKWKCGLHVKDWRYVARICNIDVSDLLAQTGTQAATAATAVMKMMIAAQASVPSEAGANFVFYVPRVIKKMLAVAALDRSQSALAIQPAGNQFGMLGPGFPTKQLEFFGTPVRTCDRITQTEAAVS